MAFPELEGQTILREYLLVLRTGEPSSAVALRVRARDVIGELRERYFDSVIHPLRDTKGVVVGVVSIQIDVTDQVLVQRRLEEATRAKDEFLAMLGHELRNPLSPILTALQLMRMRGALSREQEIIERQVSHLTRLVDDLLDVSRITGGKASSVRGRWRSVKWSRTHAGTRPDSRILVVDDNHDAAATLAEALEELGYQVRVAHDGPEALLATQTFQPHIALVDIVMDGYLREVGRVHLVAVTGYGQEADRLRAASAGFERHLVKPVDVNKLDRVMRKLCA